MQNISNKAILDIKNNIEVFYSGDIVFFNLAFKNNYPISFWFDSINTLEL